MARTPGLSVPLLFLLVLVVVAAAFLFLMSHQETEAGAANRRVSPITGEARGPSLNPVLGRTGVNSQSR